MNGHRQDFGNQRDARAFRSKLRVDCSEWSMKRARLVMSLTVVGVAMAAASLACFRPALVWNFSPSLAEGLYRLEDRPWHRGDLVALRPDGRAEETLNELGALPDGRLLLKRITAAAGDIVCREHNSVSVNGVQTAIARQATARGWPLPAWSGCSTLSPETVFVLGDHPDSLDGRYFGPVSTSSIVGVILPVATFPAQGASHQ